MRGSVQLTFDEFTDDLGFDGLFMGVGAYEDRYNRFIDCDRIYTTFVNTGELFEIEVSVSPSFTISSRIVVYRIDYTTDDVNGDNGVKETYIGENVNPSGSTYYSFTATTRPDAYAFEYRVKCYTDGCFPNDNIAFNGPLYDIEAQPDGKILCSGTFTQYSGTNVNNICRLNSNGTLDTTFNYTEATSVFGVGDMKLLSDGDIIARIQSFRVGKIKSNGQLDSTFNIGSFNAQIPIEEEVIEIQPDGKILFAGAFTTYTSAGQTSTKRNIVRLNPNGTIDNTFNQFGTGFGTSSQVRDLCLQPDGKILVAGLLNSYNGVTLSTPGLIRLNPDGSLDTSFIRNTSTGVDGYEVEILSDGKILFYTPSTNGYNGDTSRKLVRLNPDGSLDTSFPNTALSLSPTTYQQVGDILVDNLDRIYICGTSLIYSGVTVPSLIRLNYNGTADSTFSDGAGFGTQFIGVPGTPRALTLTNTGSLYAGGSFLLYFTNSIISVNIMKIRPNGTPFLC